MLSEGSAWLNMANKVMMQKLCCLLLHLNLLLSAINMNQTPHVKQTKIVSAQPVPSLVSVPPLHCLSPGRKSASGAGDEQPNGNEFSLCLFILHWLEPFSFPRSFLIYCFFGGLGLLWTFLVHLGYFSTDSLAGTYQGKYGFSYLHEAYRLTAAWKMIMSHDLSVYSIQDLLSTLSLLW